MTEPITPDPAAGRDTKPCTAPGCDAPIVRPTKLSRARWEETKYCSRTCTGRALSAMFLKTYDESKPCGFEECPVVLHRQSGEPPARWGARTYCSRACASRARRPSAKEESKVCVLDGCEVVFHRTRKHTDKAWNARRFCTSAHASASRKVERPARSVLSSGTPGAARAGRRRAPTVTPSRDRRPARPASPEPPPMPTPRSDLPVWRPAAWSRDRDQRPALRVASSLPPTG